MKQALDLPAIGRRIRLLRKSADLTQAEVAERCGMSISFIGHLERGSRVPSLETMLRIATLLNVSLDSLIHGMDLQVLPLGSGDIMLKTRILNNIVRVLDRYSGDWAKAREDQNEE